MGCLSRDEIRHHLETALQLRVRHRVHADRYEAHGEVFYLKSANKHPLVIHPDRASDLETQPVPGVELQPGHYKNSNLNGFPHLEGPDVSPCGLALDVESTTALEALLARIGVLRLPIASPRPTTPSPSARPPVVPFLEQLSAPEDPDALSDLAQAEAELADAAPTERDALRKARIGQGRFRDAVEDAWGGRCAVTDVAVTALLRASHIKPWRDSDNEERLDGDNGLLLVATLDAAFDAGLISFGDDGAMRCSSALGPDPAAVLGIKAGGDRLCRPPTSRQQVFLRHHRDKVLKA